MTECESAVGAILGLAESISQFDMRVLCDALEESGRENEAAIVQSGSTWTNENGAVRSYFNRVYSAYQKLDAAREQEDIHGTIDHCWLWLDLNPGSVDSILHTLGARGYHALAQELTSILRVPRFRMILE